MARINDNSILQSRQQPLQDPRSLDRVQMLNGLVKENKRSVAEQDPSEVQPPGFTERQHILTDPGVEPDRARETDVKLYGGKCQPAFRFRCVGREKVLAYGIRQDSCIVQTEMRRRTAVGAEHQDPVANELTAVVGADPAGNLFEQGRLSGAARAEKRRRVAGAEGQVNGFTEPAAIRRLMRNILEHQLLENDRGRRSRCLWGGSSGQILDPFAGGMLSHHSEYDARDAMCGLAKGEPAKRKESGNEKRAAAVAGLPSHG